MIFAAVYFTKINRRLSFKSISDIQKFTFFDGFDYEGLYHMIVEAPYMPPMLPTGSVLVNNDSFSKSQSALVGKNTSYLGSTKASRD